MPWHFRRQCTVAVALSTLFDQLLLPDPPFLPLFVSFVMLYLFPPRATPFPALSAPKRRVLSPLSGEMCECVPAFASERLLSLARGQFLPSLDLTSEEAEGQRKYTPGADE